MSYTVVKNTLVGVFLSVGMLALANYPEGWWPQHQVILLVTLALGLAATAFEPFWRQMGLAKRVREARQRDAQMRQEMGVVLLGLVEHANADWRRSGVFVHVASRWPTWLRARLRPTAFIGIDRDDENLGAAFYRYDHGPIGTTWSSKEALAENWQQVCADLRVDWDSKKAAGLVNPKSTIGRIVNSGPGQWVARCPWGRKITGSTRWRTRIGSWLWNRIDNNERWRMTLSEFRDVEHYHSLVTWPIRDPRNRRVVGVLSADIRPPPGRQVDVDLNGPLAGALNSAAGHIQELVRRGGRDA